MYIVKIVTTTNTREKELYSLSDLKKIFKEWKGLNPKLMNIIKDNDRKSRKLIDSRVFGFKGKSPFISKN